MASDVTDITVDEEILNPSEDWGFNRLPPEVAEIVLGSKLKPAVTDIRVTPDEIDEMIFNAGLATEQPEPPAADSFSRGLPQSVIDLIRDLTPPQGNDTLVVSADPFEDWGFNRLPPEIAEIVLGSKLKPAVENISVTPDEIDEMIFDAGLATEQPVPPAAFQMPEGFSPADPLPPNPVFFDDNFDINQKFESGPFTTTFTPVKSFDIIDLGGLKNHTDTIGISVGLGAVFANAMEAPGAQRISPFVAPVELTAAAPALAAQTPIIQAKAMTA